MARRGGFGKRKGGKFERAICKALSRWVSAKKRDDLFWRSAMSGGRATIHGKDVRQAGDITAVSPEGHAFTDFYFVECKHVRHLGLDNFLVKRTGPLGKFWKKACRAAKKYNREPLIIARQNGWGILVIARPGVLDLWRVKPIITAAHCEISNFSDLMKSTYRPPVPAAVGKFGS